jgi:hypothetical protein
VYYTDASGAVQRHDLTLDKNEAVGISDVRYITSVAENGIVLFELSPDAAAVLWGRCEDGSIIPVPMPVSANATEEYIYGAAQASLSKLGHHAAYSVFRRPNGSTDSTEWIQELCRFDCGAWKLAQIDISAFMHDELEGSGFEVDIVVVEQIMVARDGERTLCTVRISDLEASGKRRSQYMLVSWESTGMSIVLGKTRPIEILSFDATCSTVYGMSGSDYFSIPCSGGSSSALTMEGNKLSLLTRHGFASVTGEYVTSFVNGDIIALTRITDGASASVLKTVRDITAHYPEISYGAIGSWISVSPDGEWVVFPWNITEAESHLFAVRRDGSSLRRIAQGMFQIQGVVSDEIPF